MSFEHEAVVGDGMAEGSPESTPAGRGAADRDPYTTGPRVGSTRVR